jgi:hypothetical protein
LLNEFLKAHRKIAVVESGVAQLAASLKEQDSKIQMLSAQLELSNPAPRTACLPAVALREGGNNQ